MNVELGTEAAEFPEKEYINGILVAVCYRLPLLQISNQQALASLRAVGLVLDKPVFNRWLQSADTIGRVKICYFKFPGCIKPSFLSKLTSTKG
jgi:hypothetical protein